MTYHSSLFRRLWVYQWERFPLVIVLLTSIAVLGSTLGILQTKIDIWRMIAAFITLVLFPFHMRLFDELKDSEHDRKHYPNRPVPRGLILLQEIQQILFFVILFEIVINFWWGLSQFIALL